MAIMLAKTYAALKSAGPVSPRASLSPDSPLAEITKTAPDDGRKTWRNYRSV
jgi:hypothetical protein